MKKYVFWSFILLSSLFSGCSSEEQNTTKEPPKAVKYEAIVKSGGLTERTYSGTTVSSSQTDLSFRTGGLIQKLNVKVGQKVSKGSLLAMLDQKDVKLAYDQALADVQSAKVQYDNAASSFERTKTLYESNNVSLSDYEKAKTSYSNAESSYEISLKRLDLQQSQIEYTEIIAPMNGVISEVRSEVNEVVKSGNTILVMSSLGSEDIEVQVGLPEKYINSIQNGDSVTITLSSLDQKFQGFVTEIGYNSSLAGVTYPITVSFEDAGNAKLRPDMPAKVRFQFGSRDAEPISIAPIKAIASGVDGNYVFRLVESGETYQAQKVAVELGELTMDGYEIKSGIEDGDIVAVAALSYLYDGREVKLLKN